MRALRGLWPFLLMLVIPATSRSSVAFAAFAIAELLIAGVLVGNSLMLWDFALGTKIGLPSRNLILLNSREVEIHVPFPL